MFRLQNYTKPKSESRILDYCLDTLDPVHRAAICYRFGIGSRPMNYIEIGLIMGTHLNYWRKTFTPAAARMWVLKGLEVLQRNSRAKYLKDVLEIYKEKDRKRSYVAPKGKAPCYAMNEYHGYGEDEF